LELIRKSRDLPFEVVSGPEEATGLGKGSGGLWDSMSRVE